MTVYYNTIGFSGEAGENTFAVDGEEVKVGGDAEKEGKGEEEEMKSKDFDPPPYLLPGLVSLSALLLVFAAVR